MCLLATLTSKSSINPFTFKLLTTIDTLLGVEEVGKLLAIIPHTL